MIENAGALVGVPVGAAYQPCEYGLGLQYNGFGFVWGRLRSNGAWKFYVHYVQAPPMPVLGAPPPPGPAFRTSFNGKWAQL